MNIGSIVDDINSRLEEYNIEKRILRIYKLDSSMTSYDYEVLKKKIIAQLAAVQNIVTFVLDVFGENFIEVIHCLDSEHKFFYKKTFLESTSTKEELDGYLFLEKVEGLKNVEGERLFGQYYTPENIVETIIKMEGIDFENLQNKRLIDPSCGAGIFYLKIIDILIKRKMEISEISNIVKNTFWGYDIDEISLFLTKLCICVHLKTKFGMTNNDIINIGNYLNLHFVNENTLLFDDNNFDYVVGNPPYFKIKDSKTIKKKYKEYIRGQSNAYALFLVWALHNVKDNGKICFIIPQSIRNGRHFELIRKFLAKFSVTNIYYLDSKNRKKIFKDVEQAVMIITIEKKKKNKYTKIFIDKNNYVTEEKYLQKDIISQERILIPESKDVFEITSILDQSLKFKDVEKDLVFGNGLFVWNQKKGEIVGEGTNLPIIYANYLKTNNFNFIPQKNNSDKDRKPYCPKYNNESFIYQGKRLLVKRTSSMENFKRIISCIINDSFLEKFNEGYFVENHVNVLYKKNNKKEEINVDDQLYILAYLCSDLANFYIYQTNGNTQVSANELNNLPFKIEGKNYIVEEMKKAEPNWRLINNHFYDIFQINKSLQKTISKIKGEL